MWAGVVAVALRVIGIFVIEAGDMSGDDAADAELLVDLPVGQRAPRAQQPGRAHPRSVVPVNMRRGLIAHRMAGPHGRNGAWRQPLARTRKLPPRNL